MKTLFIESRKKFQDSQIDLPLLDNLQGKTISLAATVQYLALIPKVKEYLESRGKKVLVKKGVYHEGHVLGCNSSAFDKKADTFLMITDGKFHSINNAIQIQKEIYVFNTKTLEKISQKEIDEHNKKTEAKKKKFLLAKNVGLLVSTKQGQNFSPIKKIKGLIKSLNKKTYIFEADRINSLEFENFPQIPIWINTACKGLARDDNKIINLLDLQEFLKN